MARARPLRARPLALAASAVLLACLLAPPQAAAQEPAAATAPAAPQPQQKCELVCRNGGKCALTKSANPHPYCACAEGYTGPACELQGRVCSLADAPASSPSSAATAARVSLLAGAPTNGNGAPAAGATVFCQNGGSCAVTEVPSPTGGIAVVKRPACDCSTAPGFGGRFCHLRSVRCPNPLSAVRECYNGGTCPESSAGGNALCRCPRGYAGDQCEVDMGGSLGAGADGGDRARSAGWGGGPGKGVGALTREQELALLAQQGVDVNGDGMPGWQVALIVVGSALGAVALVASLLAVAVHRRRSEQDRLTAEHNARRRMRRNGGGNSTSGGGGSRKAPLSHDEEQPGANGGGLPMARGAATAPVSSPLASGLKPPARAADLW